MWELTKGPITDEYADLSLRVPKDRLGEIADKLKKFCELINLPVREVNTQGEELFSLDDVFPDLHKGSAIKGLRLRDGLTQKDLAERIGVHPSNVSEMERGKRPIGKDIARRLAEALNSDYRVFL